MQYLLAALVFVLVRAEIELSHFTVGPTASAIHQLTPSLILVGTTTGSILTYTNKGQLLNELRGPHTVTITSIKSYTQNDSEFMIVSDKQGLLTVWDQKG